MSQDLLESLLAVGQVESEGTFSLDRSKAREKMRRFQLPDPRSYVLELVQAAVIKGATAIRFDIDPLDMVMQFDGAPFALEDFDGIYGAAFTRVREPSLLARKQLALGLNAAMALAPRAITVESGDGSGRGVRLELRPDDQHDRFEPCDTSLAGTRIHVRERFRFDSLWGFARNLVGKLPEEHYLRERCRFATATIDLEGRVVSHGLQLPAVEDAAPIVADGIQGTGGRTRDPDTPARLHLVKDGVWITSVELPGRGFEAVAEGAALTKDLSQQDIVRDEVVEQVLAEVQRARDALAAALAARFVRNEPLPKRGLEIILEQMIVGAGPHLLDPQVRHTRLGAACRLPLWQTLSGAPLCLDDIADELARAGVIYLVEPGTWRPEHVVPRGATFVVTTTALTYAAHFLHCVIGPRLVRTPKELNRALACELLYHSFRERRAEISLPQGEWLVVASHDTADLRLELGISGACEAHSTLAFLLDGCLLEEIVLDSCPLGGLHVRIAGPFEPDANYHHANRNDTFARAISRVLELLPDALEQLCALQLTPRQEAWRARTAHALLLALARSRGNLGDAVLGNLGLAPKQRPPSFFAMGLPTAHAPAERPPHAIAGLPLFELLDGTRVSLAELASRAIAQGRVPCWSGRQTLPLDIVRVNREDEIVLGWALGRQALEDGSAQVQRYERQRQRISRAPATPSVILPHGALELSVADNAHDIHGRLGLQPGRFDALHRGGTIELHDEGGLLTRLEVVCPGALSGYIASNALEPNDDFTDAVAGPVLDAAHLAAARGVAALIAQASTQVAPGRDLRLVEFLQECAALAFPTVTLRTLYDTVARTDSSEAEALHEMLLARPRSAFDEQLQEAVATLRRQPLIDRARELAEQHPSSPLQRPLLDALFAPRAEGWATRARAPIAELATTPLFVAADGEPLSIARLAERIEAAQSIFVSDDPPDPQLSLPTPVIALRTERERTVLQRIFGRQALRDGSAIVARSRAARRSRERARVEQVALAEDAALVRIALEQPPLRGELGLSAHHPADPLSGSTLRLELYADHLHLDTITRQLRGLGHLVAAIDDDRLRLRIDSAGVADDASLSRVISTCADARAALVQQLLDRMPSLTDEQALTAWLHLLDFLVSELPPAREKWALACEREPVLRRALAFPGLTTVTGERVSLETVARAYDARSGRDGIGVLDATRGPWLELPAGFPGDTLVVSRYEDACLSQLFGPLRDRGALLHSLQRAQANRSAAPRPRQWADHELLASHEVATAELEGRLVLPHPDAMLRPDRWSVDLVASGRVAGWLQAHSPLHACGSLEGAAVLVADDWSGAGLSSAGQRAFEREVIALYTQLAERFEALPEGQRREAAAALLVPVLAHLRSTPGRSPHSALRPLEQLLRTLPILPLADGRRIALEAALEARPAELAHLGLWSATAHVVEDTRETAPAPASQEPAPERELPPPAEVVAPPVPPEPRAALEQSEPLAREPEPAVAVAAQAPRPAEPAAPRADDGRAARLARFADRLRHELRLVRSHDSALLDEVHLERLSVASLGLRQAAVVATHGGLQLDAEHPAVAYALERYERDPNAIAFVVSLVYTALNRAELAITDAHEVAFHARLAALAASG